MTGIPYVDETVNAVIGCTKCSPACKNCWAIGTVKRLRECAVGRCGTNRFNYSIPLNESGNDWSGKVVVNLDAFGKCKGRPKNFLLSSFGDWLHESLSIDQIKGLLERMGQYAGHGYRFYTLTKRPERWKELGPIQPNVCLGASVWDQKSYDSALMNAYRNHGATHWLSIEPMLDKLNLFHSNKQGSWPSWVVIGCESGPKRRPCKIEWIRSIVQQCKEYRIPCFVKQIEMPDVLVKGKTHVGRDPAEWPEDLRVQEKPQ